jgi:hypothetical protein
MRLHPSIQFLFVLSACGGMDRFEDDADPFHANVSNIGQPHSPTVVPAGEEDVPVASESGDVFQFALTDGHCTANDDVMEILSTVFHSDIALDQLSSRSSMTDVRMGGVLRDLTPPSQDPCVATREPFEAFSDSHDRFQINVNGRDLEFGQPFGLSTVTLSGSWNEEANTIQEGEVLLEVEASAFAESLLGSSGPESCDLLAKVGFPCVTCQDAVCVAVLIEDVPVYALQDFLLEPLTPQDIEHGSCH